MLNLQTWIVFWFFSESFWFSCDSVLRWTWARVGISQKRRLMTSSRSQQKGQVLETKIQTASRSRDLLYLTIDFSFLVLSVFFCRIWSFFFSDATKWTTRKNMPRENIKTRTGILGERRRVEVAGKITRPRFRFTSFRRSNGAMVQNGPIRNIGENK